MALSFEVTETMIGTHHFVEPALGDASERECYFRVSWGSGLAQTFGRLAARRPLEHGFTGFVFAEGLTPREASCRGTLILDYFHDATLKYDLTFEVGGRLHRLHAEKQDVQLASPVQLIKTHTTAYSEIRDENDRVISRGVLHFRPDSLGGMLRSFRLFRPG